MIDYKRLLLSTGIVFGCILLGFITVYIIGLMAMYVTFEMFFWTVIAAFLLWCISLVYLILEDENTP